MRTSPASLLSPFLAASLLIGTCHAQAVPRDEGQRAGRAVQIEDFYRIQSVGSPQLRADGAWVLYTVSEPVEEDNSSRSEVWIVKADGSQEPRRIQHGGGDVSNAQWTDEGRLQFNAQGTYTLDVDSPGAEAIRGADARGGRGRRGARGGGARRGGRRGGGRQIPNPDGTRIAIVRDTTDRLADEPEYASEFERRHQERFEGAIFDWMNFQRDGGAFPVPDPRAVPEQEIFLGNTGAREATRITDLGLRPSGVVWHPSGEFLAFTADSHYRDEMTYGRSDLWTVSVNGQVTRVTDDGYTYGSLSFSPDGRFLLYSRSYGTDMIIDQKLDHGGSRDLFLRSVESGETVNLTGDWDLDPGGPQWAPDGTSIYLTAGIGGATHLFRIPIPGGGVEQVTEGQRRIRGLSFDREFEKIAFTVGRFEGPSEVHIANIDGSQEKQLTHVHRGIEEEIAFSRAERLLFDSADGTPIEGWLLYPFGFDASKGPYPMVVNSHGGPHSASGYGFSFKHQYFAANGYFVLQVNFRSSTGYGDGFKWATWGAWGDKDGQDVMAGIDTALARFPIDPKRVGHTGHSYGGFMTNWLITQYPDRFAAAIAGAGISNWISDYGTADIARTKETEFFGTPWEEEARARLIRQSPLTYAGRVTAPTLFVHGENDQRVPYEEAEQMYVALKKNGVPAKMIQYAGQSHGIRGHWNNVHRIINETQWWNRYLKSDR